MSTIITEIVIILALVLANGLFATAEISLVAARRSRLKHLADNGEERAQKALNLAENPNRFLATVQVGITLVGVLAGAYGAATLSGHLAEALGGFAWLRSYAQPLSFGLIVLMITYLSLVFGELVPKRLGLNNPEGIAMRLAGTMHLIASVAGPVVTFLSTSTDAILRLFGFKPNQQSTVSEDEVKVLLREGLSTGTFLPAESAMVESVLALDRIPVRELMTPRPKIIWVNLHDPHEAIWHKIVVSGHSVFPVYDSNRDNVVGMLSVKSIYANLAAGAGVAVKDLMTPSMIVPASQPANLLLESFKKSGRHAALVADEFGGIIGLVTLHDIMEAIVGDFPSQDERLKPTARPRDDGSWLIDAMIEVPEFEKAIPQFKLDPPGRRDYQTFGGFIVKHLGRVPTEGESFQLHGFLVEIIDMDRHRVDKVLLMPLKKGGGNDG